MIQKIVLLITVFTVFLSCSPTLERQKIRIAINPWPGYEFLYLAAEKGFFADEGLDVEIIELSSLADVQRVYIQGRVDGFGSTVIEAVQAAGITQQPVSIVLVPDFSNGGDVIVANGGIRNISELKGKKIGAEVGSLGMFVLYAALAKYNLSLDDVQVTNVEQLDAERAMRAGEIDAMVTYPPYSIAVNKLPNHRQIFDTSEIPGKVIDVISIRGGLIADQKLWQQKFHQVWQRVLDYSVTNKKEAYEIMARREGVSVEEFSDAISGLTIVSSIEQHKLLKSQQLADNISEVCNVLRQSNSVRFGCNNINELVQGSWY